MTPSLILMIPCGANDAILVGNRMMRMMMMMIVMVMVVMMMIIRI